MQRELRCGEIGENRAVFIGAISGNMVRIQAGDHFLRGKAVAIRRADGENGGAGLHGGEHFVRGGFGAAVVRQLDQIAMGKRQRGFDLRRNVEMFIRDSL